MLFRDATVSDSKCATYANVHLVKTCASRTPKMSHEPAENSMETITQKPTENGQPGSLRSGDLFGIWVPTAERVPANPEGFPRNDHVPCLCAWLGENVGGDMRILQWNAYYKVWDDAYGDDFFCNAQEVTHWMPLPPWPNTKATDAEATP